MFSEHCEGAKATVLVLKDVPRTCTLDDFSLMNSSTWKNPMQQQYVFYNDESWRRYIARICRLVSVDFLNSYQSSLRPSITSLSHPPPFLPKRFFPAIHCSENCYEPRLSTEVSLKYLKNVRAEVRKSSKSWKERYLLERMRQGRFKTAVEAFENGWSEVNISIIGSHLQIQETTMRRRESVSMSSFFDPIDQKSRNSIENNPIDEARILGNEDDMGTRISRRLSVFTSAEIMTFDEITSSYYEVSVESRQKLFSRAVGSTNVEYVTDKPVYGSNINAHVVTKPVKIFSSNDGAWINTEPTRYTGKSNS